MSAAKSSRKPFVFISYSSRDKAFARQIDATLVGNGMSVFLDERNIRIGDSIPKRIYESIGRATHVIYVLSEHSQKSKWVQEEIDAAKMRQNSGSGCAILPVKIDDSRLPASLQHIKYADFTHWQDNRSYVSSFRQLAEALGLQLRAPGTAELRFFLSHHDDLAEIESTARMLVGIFEVAVEADFAQQRPYGIRSGMGTRTVFKWNVEEGGHLEKLRAFRATLERYGPGDGDGKLGNVLVALDGLLTTLGTVTREDSEDYSVVTDMKLVSYRLAGVIADLRTTMTSILAATHGGE